MTDFGSNNRVTSPTLQVTIFCCALVFCAVLAMSFIFEVEIVARGKGRVVPVDRVQVVQPEYAGRIAAIHVANGARVEKGDVLIELDATDALADLATVQAEQDRLIIENERLHAQLQALENDPEDAGFVTKSMSSFMLPPSLAAHPFAETQRLLLAAELEDYLASIAQLRARDIANRKAEAVSIANIDRMTASIETQTERLRVAEQLEEQGTTSRSALLDVQQTFTELERQRDVYQAELDQKFAERNALDSERQRIVADIRNNLRDRAAQIDARLATLSEEARTATRHVAAATLTAPTSGIVDRLSIFTIGGVAEAGAELLRVVPTESAVEIEGTFSNQDIGFMQENQPANIRLDAYPSERFGFVRGQVSKIAADSTEVSAGQWGYVVRITPDQPFLKAGNDSYALRPGMTATIDVTTDKRRIISYFFAPIVRTIEDAIGER